MNVVFWFFMERASGPELVLEGASWLYQKEWHRGLCVLFRDGQQLIFIH